MSYFYQKKNLQPYFFHDKAINLIEIGRNLGLNVFLDTATDVGQVPYCHHDCDNVK